ncbi:MAG TPA: hypothetical protein VFP95_06450, partial [Gammaproteobacteria bacterium]|nr:hypothetical protein [Gammaproteobacteria bacterium]
MTEAKKRALYVTVGVAYFLLFGAIYAGGTSLFSDFWPFWLSWESRLYVICAFSIFGFCVMGIGIVRLFVKLSLEHLASMFIFT